MTIAYSTWQEYAMPLFEHFEGLGTNFDGKVSKPYICAAGRVTIGYGHQIFPGEEKKYLNGVSVPEAKRMLLDKKLYKQFLGTLKGLTVAESEELLKHDSEEFAKGVAKLLKRPALPCQFAALVCLAYNIGMSDFAHNCTVLRCFNAGDAKKAAEWFAPWCHDDNKKVLPGLSRRRKCETKMFQGWTPEKLAEFHWFIGEFK